MKHLDTVNRLVRTLSILWSLATLALILIPVIEAAVRS